MRQILRTYLDSFRQALALSDRDGDVSIGLRPVWVYGLTLIFLMVWWHYGPPVKPEFFFVEGGPIDWLNTVFLFTAALLAWSAWIAGKREGEPATWFWPVSAVGLAFLCFDERFQLHEHVLSDWQDDVFGEVPFGLRNWNDAVVIVYGLIALAVLVSALPAVVRYRGVRKLLVAAFALYAIHTFLDATDQWFDSHPIKEALEEGAKVLSGASLMLAYLQASLGRASPGTPFRLSRLQFAVAAVILLVGPFLLIGDADWLEAAHHWGDAIHWFIAMCIGSAAILAWLGSLGDRERELPARWFPYAAGSLFFGIAFDLETIASRYRFGHEVVRDDLPRMLSDNHAVFHRPYLVPALLVAVALVLVTLLGWRRLRNHRGSAIVFASAVALLVTHIVISLLVEDPEDSLLLSGMLIVATAGLVLSLFVQYVAGVLKTAP